MLFSEGAKALPPGLRKDDEGDEVLALQKRLILLGFLDGGADGKYGKQTEKAVTAFQRHLIAQGMSVPASGEATPVTRELLANAGRSTYLTDILPGDKAGETLRVERRLRDLGYLDAKPDDGYDEYAARAARAFQRSAGIPETGVVDKITVDALFSEGAPAAERFVAHDIKEGDRSRAVEAVQARLAQYGFLAAYPDGKFSGGTTAALERFYNYLVETGNPRAELFSEKGMLGADAQDLLEDEDFFAYRVDVKRDAPEGEVQQAGQPLADGALKVFAAFSRDGKAFELWKGNPLLTPGGGFDSKGLYVGPGAVPGEKPGTYWFYYVGTSTPHDDNMPEKTSGKGGLGRFLLEIRD